MTERIITVDTRDRGPVTLPEPLWCVTDHTEPLAQRAEIHHIGAEHQVMVRSADRPRELLSMRLEQYPFVQSADLRRAHVNVTLSSDYDPSFPCGSDDLDRLTADLLEAAGWVRRVGRRLTIESRLGGA